MKGIEHQFIKLICETIIPLSFSSFRTSCLDICRAAYLAMLKLPTTLILKTFKSSAVGIAPLDEIRGAAESTPKIKLLIIIIFSHLKKKEIIKVKNITNNINN